MQPEAIKKTAVNIVVVHNADRKQTHTPKLCTLHTTFVQVLSGQNNETANLAQVAMHILVHCTTYEYDLLRLLHNKN